MSQVPIQNQNQNQKLQLQYDQFQQTIEQLSNKISQLQGDVDEHSIVIETLNNVPKDRKCFRMIGGALVEKTSGEVAPVLETNLKNMVQAVTQLSNELKETQKNFFEWKQKNNVKIVSAQ